MGVAATILMGNLFAHVHVQARGMCTCSIVSACALWCADESTNVVHAEGMACRADGFLTMGGMQCMDACEACNACADTASMMGTDELDQNDGPRGT